MRQPELMDAWGCTFYGRAETVTGDVWWYTQDGKRYPLLPRNPQTENIEGAIEKIVVKKPTKRR